MNFCSLPSLFSKKSVYKGITYFKCYDEFCTTRIKVDERGVCQYTTENCHLHDPHNEIFLKWKLINEIKTCIRTTTMTPKEAFDEHCNRPLFQSVARELEFYSIKTTLHRIKRRECPREPITANDIPSIFEDDNVFARFGKTVQVSQDIFYKGCVNSGRERGGESVVSCIFASDTIIKKINQTDQLQRKFYLDGTFYVVPDIFYQLLIVTFQVGDVTFPFLYVLMTGKKKDQYIQLFQYINANIIDLKPAEMMLDFEVGLRLAIKNVFPECKLQGCFFHFGQCQQKFISKQRNLFAEIKNNPNVKRIFHKFISLALLPSGDILFEDLKF